VAPEAEAKIDAIFDIGRQINGLDATSRLAARRRLSRPLAGDLRDGTQAEPDTIPRPPPVAKAITCMFRATRRDAFACILDGGRIRLANNAAERALRGVVLGGKSWLCADAGRGGDRAALIYSLIVTAKRNDVGPRARLADLLSRLPGATASQAPELLPRNRSATRQGMAA